MSLTGLKKQYNKVSQVSVRDVAIHEVLQSNALLYYNIIVQFMIEKTGKDEGTPLDDDYKELERVSNEQCQCIWCISYVTSPSPKEISVE